MCSGVYVKSVFHNVGIFYTWWGFFFACALFICLKYFKVPSFGLCLQKHNFPSSAKLQLKMVEGLFVVFMMFI